MAFSGRPHRHEFFGRRGMQRHGGVEIGLGRLHFDRNAENLHHLGRAIADDVATQHAIRRRIHDKLHQDTGIATRQCRFHRTEGRLVYIDVGELRASLRLGQTYRADLGLGKDRSRNIRMIYARGLVPEHRIRKRVPFPDGNRRQVEAMRDIADRMDMRYVRLRKAVNGNAAVLRVDGNACLLEAEICNVWMPADRKQHLIGGNAGLVR